MGTFTRDDLLKFINEQPDDRPVNFREPDCTCECGCLLVHFGEEKLGLEEFECGYSELIDPWARRVLASGGQGVDPLIKQLMGFDPETYGELKQLVMENPL